MHKIKLIIILLFLSTVTKYLYADQDIKFRLDDNISIIPIEHANFAMHLSSKTVFVDPVGSYDRYAGLGAPDIILITDIHRDHLDAKLLEKLVTGTTDLAGPEAVIEDLGYGIRIDNGQTEQIDGISIKAVPMYNTTSARMKYHVKGRGNGYLISFKGKKLYISGDTEDIPEIRSLKDIDYAFLCMNLPYTMSIEQAASAVLEFKPKTVIPYHYRGTEGMSDIEKFKKLVSVNKSIKVLQFDWYGSKYD